MKFTEEYCGWPGAVHYARVLRNRPLFHDIEGRTDDLFPGQTYIIGDAAYLLKTWLLTGFKDNGHLTAQQIRFTHLLSSKRITVERSIGLLKGRFRKLKGSADVYRTRFLPKLITAVCTLHNFCIYSPDEIEYFLDPDDDDGDRCQ
ncbi:putative nuclease HARBI1 [Acropora millepora]|uniref:putative nuclease HARBI1 n=1 Tax=Acropora millepora TaxID=45264 RepID=UPI001CF3F49C|nr:putative nuclease HARBI1 [Acropora millepora]